MRKVRQFARYNKTCTHTTEECARQASIALSKDGDSVEIYYPTRGQVFEKYIYTFAQSVQIYNLRKLQSITKSVN